MAKRPFEELYDIIKDPSCQNNLIADNQYKKDKDRLVKRLDAYLIKTGDPRVVSSKLVWDHLPYYFQNPNGITPYPKLNNKKVTD
jgi:hypothetical protein